MISPKLRRRRTVAQWVKPETVQHPTKGTCWGLVCSLDMKVTEGPCQVEPCLLSSSSHHWPPPQVKSPAPNRGTLLPSPPAPPLHVHVGTHTHNCTLFLSLTLSAPLFPKMPLPLSWSFSTKILKYHLIKQSAWPSTPSTLLNRT